MFTFENKNMIWFLHSSVLGHLGISPEVAPQKSIHFQEIATEKINALKCTKSIYTSETGSNVINKKIQNSANSFLGKQLVCPTTTMH